MVTVSEIVQEIIDSGAIYLVNPALIQTTVDDFLDKYGHLLDVIGLYAKGSNGFTFFPSNNAPKHPNLSIYFHSFCTIADNMGIKVDAFSHVHRDSFLVQNADFRVQSSDGEKIDLFACPSHPYINQYNSAIVSEIVQYPVNKLVLDNILFANLKACFCDRCRRLFAQKWNIERDFSYDFLKSRDFYDNWVEFRTTLIENTLREITDSMKRIKNVDLAFIIKADKETDYLTGTEKVFGQNIANMLKITNNLIIHVNPWTEIPSADSEDFQILINSLSSLLELSKTGVDHSLLFWGVNNKEKLDLVLKLSENLNPNNIYIQDIKPTDFTKLRQINLGF